jgi:hypothetical protein
MMPRHESLGMVHNRSSLVAGNNLLVQTSGYGFCDPNTEMDDSSYGDSNRGSVHETHPLGLDGSYRNWFCSADTQAFSTFVAIARFPATNSSEVLSQANYNSAW